MKTIPILQLWFSERFALNIENISESQMWAELANFEKLLTGKEARSHLVLPHKAIYDLRYVVAMTIGEYPKEYMDRKQGIDETYVQFHERNYKRLVRELDLQEGSEDQGEDE